MSEAYVILFCFVGYFCMIVYELYQWIWHRGYEAGKGQQKWLEGLRR